jgi:hypothetical protein
VEFLYLLFVVRGLDRIASEYIFCACNQALLPILDLIGVNIKLLGQFSQGVVGLSEVASRLVFPAKRCFPASRNSLLQR